MNKLKETKLVIITSYYESLSNFMIESLNMGCNILISDTIGGSEFINNLCIANSDDDFILKTEKLLNEKVNCVKNFEYSEKKLFEDLQL
jgi:glycosyltransferase involved in cell wall biosynthesis